MIVSMQKVRILAPREQATSVIATLQDLGVVHVCPPSVAPPLYPLRLTPRQARHVLQVQRALEDVEEALAQLAPVPPSRAGLPQTPEEPIPREVRLARRARRAASALAGEARLLEERREELARLVRVFEAFVEMGVVGSTPSTRTFYLVLGPETRDGATRLDRMLADALGDGFALESRTVDGGERAVALLVREADAARMEALFPEAGVRELELPEDCVDTSPAAALEGIRRRLAAVEAERSDLTRRRQRLAEWLRPGLLRARGAFRDWLAAAEALQKAAASGQLFVLEGWLPASERAALWRALLAAEGERVVVEDVARETWSARDVPVAIQNPRIFRPFEVITRRLPLPRYGTIDPTPFLAVFFPMFFGLILGDLGYAAVLAALAAVGWLRSAEGSLLRSLSQIAAACAAFAAIFGLLFGELFGDLGRRVLGMRALAFSREDALVPFLSLAVAVGLVHVLLGLVLGALSSFRSDPRHSLGRGLAAVMLVLTAAGLLAAANVLPRAFFTPAAVALLLSLPVLIVLEGAAGPIEFLSRLGNVLSYARIMALGTASVMLAVAANRLVGTLGGVAVGVLFATLFHLVNFGLGVFSPTIHALRLHFVEFFGTFYSPGGMVYRPLRHGSANGAATPSVA